MKIQYLLSFAEEGTEVKERCKKENDFSKFVNFVQVIEAYSQKMLMVTYHFFKFSFAYLK